MNQLRSLENAIDALGANDGGDCSEYGMTGILKTLNISDSYSNIIVLTDASPKDAYMTKAVIDKATEKHNAIHFFLSKDSCGDLSPYHNVATSTHGIVMDEINELTAFVDFALKYHESIHTQTEGSKKKRQITENCVKITVSAFTKSIDVLSLSGSNGFVINITNPKWSIDKRARGSIDIYSNRDPLSGVYTICSTRVLKYYVVTKSDLDFFVEYDVNVSKTSLPTPGIVTIVQLVVLKNYYTPITCVGTPVKVLISSSSYRINEISTEGIYLDLLLHDGIISFPMVHCSSLLSGVIIVPSVPFRYQLRGYDSKGNGFVETKKTKLYPKAEICDLPTPTSSTVVTSSTTVTTPTASPIPPLVCPCRNGGRCIRFGRTQVQCVCQPGHAGSLCQISKFVIAM